MRRDQIVRAAVELFVEKGFHRTTTREIARASGLGIGTLYEYVESKEDVLYLVCDFIHNEVEEQLMKALDPNATGRDAIIQAIRALFLVMDHLQDWVLFIYQETKSLPPKLMSYVLRREEEITAHIERILVRGIADHSIQLAQESVRLTAHNIVVMGQMWTFRRWVLQKHYSLEEYIEYQTSLLLGEIDVKRGKSNGN